MRTILEGGNTKTKMIQLVCSAERASSCLLWDPHWEVLGEGLICVSWAYKSYSTPIDRSRSNDTFCFQYRLGRLTAPGHDERVQRHMS
jgi:hypothetical protein